MSGTTSIGENVILGRGVVVGVRVMIGNGVVIHEDTVIGDDVRIHDNAVVGKLPMKAKTSATTTEGTTLTPAIIENGCTIGTGAIVYRGAHLSHDVFVADLATVRERVHVGEATIIGRGVAIENDCSIGARCKLETNSYICAYSVVEDDVFIAPCVVTTNDNYLARTNGRFSQFKGVTVKQGGRIGANATILPGKVIHQDGVVAAGSVVTKDVPARTIVAGNPARKLRDVPEEQWLEKQHG
ncbi:acyltransferase [Paenibacillus sp. strain BS8-2]